MVQQSAEQTIHSAHGLENHGLHDLGNIYWNLTTAALYEHAIRNREGLLAHLGPLVVRTGSHTGRSPNDKFVVRDTETEGSVWWGQMNHPFEPQDFDHLLLRLQAYFQHRDVYVQDCYSGADPRYRLPIRIITERAWHSLFAHTLFIRATREELPQMVPQFTLIQAPGFHATPEVDNTLSPTFILLNFSKRLILIGGTEHAGEIKKAMFSVLNYMLPHRDVLSMHCSASYGKDKKDVAIFFGLAGTGKTTLSADPKRTLIGDDEHGWSSDGIFNFEGGCYAKVIGLRKETEPDIYEMTRRFGTILENVVMDVQTRRLDLDNSLFTENTRAAYSIEVAPHADPGGVCGHPKHVIFLTTDALGVLPPVAKLTPEQAVYQFISGYAARVSDIGRSVSEPVVTFSPCFGAPFLPLHPIEYANLLQERLRKHKAQVWLVNTGWTGGPYGTGQRINLEHTRAIISAILDGSLAKVSTVSDPIFGLAVPERIPGLPDKLLNPRSTWADPAAYDAKALEVARMFKANFESFAAALGHDVEDAGPRV
jgi:phosphoenolpyruvate carboxykinase (ATP)